MRQQTGKEVPRQKFVKNSAVRIETVLRNFRLRINSV